METFYLLIWQFKEMNSEKCEQGNRKEKDTNGDKMRTKMSEKEKRIMVCKSFDFY